MEKSLLQHVCVSGAYICIKPEEDEDLRTNRDFRRERACPLIELWAGES